MTVETVTYVSDFNVNYPAAGDLRSEGASHLRNMKSGAKNTFPNVTGAVTPTHTVLNYMVGVTSAVQTQLDSKLGITAASGSAGGTLSAARMQVYVFTGSSPATQNLPASPTVGDMVIFSNGGSATLTIGRNGKAIDGVTSDRTLDANNIGILVYGTAIVDGWTLS